MKDITNADPCLLPDLCAKAWRLTAIGELKQAEPLIAQIIALGGGIREDQGRFSAAVFQLRKATLASFDETRIEHRDSDRRSALRHLEKAIGLLKPHTGIAELEHAAGVLRLLLPEGTR